MDRWICTVCSYVYDPEKGDPAGNIKPGTDFKDLPSDWVCPVCGVGKNEFTLIESAAENSHSGIVKTYSTRDITVIWQPEKCNHNGNCTRSLPQVFNVKQRPWININGAPAETIKKVVEQCPTGALSYR